MDHTTQATSQVIYIHDKEHPCHVLQQLDYFFHIYWSNAFLPHPPPGIFALSFQSHQSKDMYKRTKIRKYCCYFVVISLFVISLFYCNLGMERGCVNLLCLEFLYDWWNKFFSNKELSLFHHFIFCRPIFLKAS